MTPSALATLLSKTSKGLLFELAAIQTHIGNITGLRILDLACGAGYYTQKLLEWGAERVVGIDIPAAMIEFARVQCGGGDLDADNEHQEYHFQVADCSKPSERIEERNAISCSQFGCSTMRLRNGNSWRCGAVFLRIWNSVGGVWALCRILRVCVLGV